MMAEAGSKKPPMTSKFGQEGEQDFVHWNSIDDEVKGLAEFITARPDEKLHTCLYRADLSGTLACRCKLALTQRPYSERKPLSIRSLQEKFTAACLVANPDDPVTVQNAWLGFHGTNKKQGNKRNADAICQSAE